MIDAFCVGSWVVYFINILFTHALLYFVISDTNSSKYYIGFKNNGQEVMPKRDTEYLTISKQITSIETSALLGMLYLKI